MHKECNLPIERLRLAVGLTKQAWSAGPGAHKLQNAAASKAVSDGEDLVLLHQVKGAHLHGASCLMPPCQQLRCVMQCKVLA